MYKVIQDLTVKVNGNVKTFQVGSIVKLPLQAAQMFIQQGKIEPGQTEPYVTSFNVLIIPFNSNPKYHYWNGGQSLCVTLKELGRCDLIEKYKSIYN